MVVIARHILRNIAAKAPVIARRFFDDGEPRLTRELVQTLLAHTYTTHVRELESLLWMSISQSTGDALELTDELKGQQTDDPAATLAASEVTPEAIRAALDRNGGSREQAWRDLGLANRHVLKRLMKKHGLQ